MSGTIYAFGPFELDAARRTLRRDGGTVPLSDRHLEILLHLTSSDGAVLSKDSLIERAWRDVAVTDNSLEQAISALRRALSGGDYIETVPRQGYRFSGEVTRRVGRESDEALQGLLAPHRAWLEGRAALETLGRDQALAARQAFERVLASTPDYPPAHIGLANACAFQFEATRAEASPDREAVAVALHHAREACRLDSRSGEAWATLGFVLHLTREPQQAVAAVRRALAIEPDNWRHHLRLAVVSWGEERLGAAQRALALLPALALAHWLAATVHVARGALDRAEQELERGAAAQDAQAPQARFSAVALHWLLGLVCLARGDRTRALMEFDRELAFENTGQLYARECCANTWYAIGAVRLHEGRTGDAVRAFDEALSRVKGHPLALAGKARTAPAADRPMIEAALGAVAAALRARGGAVEAALAEAVTAALDGDASRAAGVLAAAVGSAGASAAWIVPVEPLLDVQRHPEAWAAVLAPLRNQTA